MRELEAIRLRLQQFSAARDWDRFHSPKNLSMALIAEAAELVEHFQWLTEAESEELPPAQRKEVEMELADILIYLIKLAERLDVDLIRAVNKKIELNEQRFPVATKDR
jgi:NTP pyrophosphatase (non-canonical NTP hydrolase)